MVIRCFLGNKQLFGIWAVDNQLFHACVISFAAQSLEPKNEFGIKKSRRSYFLLSFWFSQDADNSTDAKGNELVPNLPPPKVQKVDLAALFTARQLPMSDNECVSVITISNYFDILFHITCINFDARIFGNFDSSRKFHRSFSRFLEKLRKFIPQNLSNWITAKAYSC